MSLQNSTTYEEISQLLKRSAYSVFWKLEARLIVAGEGISIGNVVSQHRINLYDSRYYGDNYLTLEVDAVVHKLILKHVNHLEIELIKAQQSADGLVNTEIFRYSQIFTAQLTDATNPGLQGMEGINSGGGDTVEQISSLRTLTFQLIEPFISKFRISETGGVFKGNPGVTIENVLRYTLGTDIPKNATQSILSDKSYIGLRGVDVVTPSNTREYKHIVIPNNTRLTAIPRFLQEQYGIYSSGMGWHIERGRCYLYPLMDYTQYSKRTKVLTILNIPITEIPTMERTFLVRANQVYIFATGDTEHTDLSETIHQNVGNGIAYSLSGNLIDRMAVTKNNKTSYDNKSNVQKYVLNERPLADNNVRAVSGGFTDNPYAETSKTAIGLGTKMELIWDNSADHLTYPGQPVKVLYKVDGKIESLNGTLLGKEVVTKPHTSAKLDNHYITTTKLTVWVTKVPEA